MKERRKFKRLQSGEKVLLQKSGNEQQETLLLNVSLGGMRILLNNDIKVGAALCGQFKINPAYNQFYVRGNVVWVKNLPEEGRSLSFEAGVKFNKVSTIPI